MPPRRIRSSAPLASFDGNCPRTLGPAFDDGPAQRRAVEATVLAQGRAGELASLRGELEPGEAAADDHERAETLPSQEVGAPMSIRTRTARLRTVRDQLVDVAIDCYIDWREQYAGAMAAYEGWRGAPWSQRHVAFAAYQAALDQEEHAARDYATAIAAVEDLFTRANAKRLR